jgi:hypothetical protein
VCDLGTNQSRVAATIKICGGNKPIESESINIANWFRWPHSHDLPSGGEITILIQFIPTRPPAAAEGRVRSCNESIQGAGNDKIRGGNKPMDSESINLANRFRWLHPHILPSGGALILLCNFYPYALPSGGWEQSC